MMALTFHSYSVQWWQIRADHVYVKQAYCLVHLSQSHNRYQKDGYSGPNNTENIEEIDGLTLTQNSIPYFCIELEQLATTLGEAHWPRQRKGKIWWCCALEKWPGNVGTFYLNGCLASRSSTNKMNCASHSHQSALDYCTSSMSDWPCSSLLQWQNSSYTALKSSQLFETAVRTVA